VDANRFIENRFSETELIFDSDWAIGIFWILISDVQLLGLQLFYDEIVLKPDVVKN